MKKHIYNEPGDTLLRVVEDEPVCGEDFCDACGDCLSCYGYDDCYPRGGDHFWVQYGENDEDTETE
jgi:hypothetical protein